MIVIGLIVSAFGIGFLCWLMFTLAVYALPFFAGITVGLAVYHSGAGVVGAPVVVAPPGLRAGLSRASLRARPTRVLIPYRSPSSTGAFLARADGGRTRRSAACISRAAASRSTTSMLAA